MDGSKVSSISRADTDEKIGEFWDIHDFTDFDTDAPDVPLETGFVVPIEIELFNALAHQAQQRGVSLETLVSV